MDEVAQMASYWVCVGGDKGTSKSQSISHDRVVQLLWDTAQQEKDGAYLGRSGEAAQGKQKSKLLLF